MRSSGSIASLLALAVVLAAGIAACRVEEREPPKPASVPREAFWVGGPDGGAFVVLRAPPGNVTGRYQGKVFYPHGEIWYDGPLALEPKDRTPVNPADHKQFVGWDGEVLLLRDGGTLRTIRNK